MKKIFAMLLTAGMTLGVGACGQSTTNSADTLTWEQSDQEYKKTAEDFPFALSDGDQFPSDMAKATSDNQLYQKGWGEGQAYFYWICSTENKIGYSLFVVGDGQVVVTALRSSLPQVRWIMVTEWSMSRKPLARRLTFRMTPSAPSSTALAYGCPK